MITIQMKKKAFTKSICQEKGPHADLKNIKLLSFQMFKS